MGTHQGKELTRNSPGNAHPQYPLAKPPWTDPGLKTGFGVRELISTGKKTTTAGGQ